MATPKHRQPPSTCVTDTRHHLDCSTFTHSAGFQPRHCPGLAGAAKGFAALSKNHSSLQQWQCLSRAEPRGHRTTNHGILQWFGLEGPLKIISHTALHLAPSPPPNTKVLEHRFPNLADGPLSPPLYAQGLCRMNLTNRRVPGWTFLLPYILHCPCFVVVAWFGFFPAVVEHRAHGCVTLTALELLLPQPSPGAPLLTFTLQLMPLQGDLGTDSSPMWVQITCQV